MRGMAGALVLIGVVAGLVSSAPATVVNVPVDMNSWQLHSYFDQGTPSWEATPDGIRVHGAGYRLGSFITSNGTADLRNAEVHMKWMGYAGPNARYMGINLGCTFSPSPVNFQDATGANYTTGWSWNNSEVMPENTWLYSRIVTHPDMTWTIVTATGAYDDLGGSVVSSKAGSWAPYPESWAGLAQGRLYLGLGDNYGGTEAWLQLGEAKYEVLPEPATLSLLALGGLLITRRRRSLTA